jgi:hypothetical protein
MVESLTAGAGNTILPISGITTASGFFFAGGAGMLDFVLVHRKSLFLLFPGLHLFTHLRVFGCSSLFIFSHSTPDAFVLAEEGIFLTVLVFGLAGEGVFLAVVFVLVQRKSLFLLFPGLHLLTHLRVFGCSSLFIFSQSVAFFGGI